MATVQQREIGTDRERRDGPAKVTGTAPYAAEHPFTAPVHAHPVQATVARGTITAIDTEAASAVPGVLAILTHENAERLASDEDKEFWVLQSPEVFFRGQFVAVVVADSAEAAREAAESIEVSYDAQDHDVLLRPDHPDLYAPEQVNPVYPTDTEDGDVEAGLASAAATVDATYTTPAYHNNPMEPHTTVARWDEATRHLTLHDSTQSVHGVRELIAPLFGLEVEQVSVIAPHVGGGFGSKGTPHAHDVLASLAARATPGRDVKLPLTRQMLFSIAGYRTPTVQRLRLAADAEGHLLALVHDVWEQTSRIKEFAEQTAVASRVMYASRARRTSHRLAPLDVPIPSWMRAPGENPGMYAGECAIDELAIALGMDPVELRVRNEPAVDPQTGKPYSSRNLVACLRLGAERFGWADREHAPSRKPGPGGRLAGTGVAASTYPVHRLPGSEAAIDVMPDGRYRVRIGAVDLGTGTWTALAQVAAEALAVPLEQVDLRIGDTSLPHASVAGGSSGITTWGTAIYDAAGNLRDRHGHRPDPGASATGGTGDNEAAEHYAMHAFGAQFVAVEVDPDTGEITVPRALGVFAAGRIVNPRTARSQFLGGMTMGLSTALWEQSTMDPVTGHYVNHDFAEYHIATCADIRDLEAEWIEENDPHVNPMGTKGIGEIGIVGTAAAVANALHNATGIRIRDLPITPDKLLRAGL
ncbi:xanthine dehydrogenase family protein molybdopterin-binding subunit [Streptomyces cuspidosporus]|uniref:Xanthine dehydrogenase family protein molybdopterin-binding subunit n=1 Tax=Streptomyces cuspidosporus TaxID=66882 RepID=A0ABN3F9L4_9ACTN